MIDECIKKIPITDNENLLVMKKANDKARDRVP